MMTFFQYFGMLCFHIIVMFIIFSVGKFFYKIHSLPREVCRLGYKVGEMFDIDLSNQSKLADIRIELNILKEHFYEKKDKK